MPNPGEGGGGGSHGAIKECEKAINTAKPGYLISGWRQDGEEITCECGQRFVHVCDEAEGCSWIPIGKPDPPTPTKTGGSGAVKTKKEETR